MSIDPKALAAQLRAELAARAVALGPFIGPDLALEVARRVERSAVRTAELLAADDDTAAEAVTDVMVALWPDCDPEDLDPDWWRTPLGRACARSLGHDAAESVSHSVAAAMLGVPRSFIGTWKARGKLGRADDGGVSRASVLALIASDEDPRAWRWGGSTTDKEPT